MADLALAVLGGVDVCLKWGEKLVVLCKSYRHYHEGLQERNDRLEIGWLKTARQLDYMKQIDHVLDEHHRGVNARATEHLKNKLRIVLSKLEGVAMENPGKRNPLQVFKQQGLRWKYALIKESIDMAIEDLEKWQTIAEPSWYMLLRMANKPDIDRVITSHKTKTVEAFPGTFQIRDLYKSSGTSPSPSPSPGTGLSLKTSELDKMTITDIPLSTLRMAQRAGSSGVKNMILTTLKCPRGSRVDSKAKEVRELASKLNVGEPVTFCLLSCKGFVKQIDDNPSAGSPGSFTLVFRSPDNAASATSLRTKMLARNHFVSVSDRIRFARQLGQSVAYIHALGFVHKSIRPENILVFEPQAAGKSLSVFLAGFDSFRKDEGKTYRNGLDEWEQNLYLHPERQGPYPREDYQMQHDMYSLGVCLLEIGLWDSFICLDENGDNLDATPRLDQFAQDHQASRAIPQDFKNHLLNLCQRELPRYMSDQYCNVVQTCLTCLDKDNVDFGDEREFQDEDGILVGVRYIEKVLARLNDIQV